MQKPDVLTPAGLPPPPWLLLTAAHQEEGEVKGEVEGAAGSLQAPLGGWLLSIPSIPALSRLPLRQGSSRCLARQSPTAARGSAASGRGRELFRRLEGPRPLGTACQLSSTVLTAHGRVTEVRAGFSLFQEGRRMVAVTPVPATPHQLHAVSTHAAHSVLITSL